MGSYLSMAIHLLLAFGVVFELPIVLMFLARIGLVDYRWLAKQRRYALLQGFIVGAILTPPDLFSQVSIALPFVLLYEVGIWGGHALSEQNREKWLATDIFFKALLIFCVAGAGSAET